jgi:hypothetical protein
MKLARCYKATVNESETITEAQPFCPVRTRGEARERRTSGFGFAVTPPIERS